MEALPRFATRSYFWICWKVPRAASANACCERPRTLRSSRILAPTAMSIGSASASGLRTMMSPKIIQSAGARRRAARWRGPLGLAHALVGNQKARLGDSDSHGAAKLPHGRCFPFKRHKLLLVRGQNLNEILRKHLGPLRTRLAHVSPWASKRNLEHRAGNCKPLQP